MPAQSCKWLGFDLDFKAGRISVGEVKIEFYLCCIDRLLQVAPIVQARPVAGVIGQLISMSRAVGQYSRLSLAVYTQP